MAAGKEPPLWMWGVIGVIVMAITCFGASMNKTRKSPGPTPTVSVSTK